MRIKVLHPTWAKSSTQQAINIDESERFVLDAGEILEIDWFDEFDGHYLLGLSRPRNGYKQWYVYAKHVEPCDEANNEDILLRLTKPLTESLLAKQVQDELQSMGYEVEADGVYGPNTAIAVREFQIHARLTPDGIVGPATMDALMGGTIKPEPSDLGKRQLTKNISLETLIRSSTAARYGIDNSPPNHKIAALRALAENVLQPVWDSLGALNITSGYRSPQLNRAVRGSATSQHMAGEAADFTVQGRSVREVCDWIAANLVYDQLIYEFGSWIHVSFRATGTNRKSYFDIT